MSHLRYEYGILEFSSKSRVQANGVMFRPFAYGKRTVVRCNRPRSCDVWAKIERRDNGPGRDPEQHLVEILGEVGNADVESEMLRLHYHITPCKYPDVPSTFPHPVVEGNPEPAVTVDNSYTLDRDDAISLALQENGAYTVGIHITDTTRLPLDLLAWAKQRGASAYWSSADGKHYTKPMLPPALAHGEFSLNKGTIHPCISLYMEYDATHALQRTHYRRSWVRIEDNLTYEGFGSDAKYAPWLERLRVITGKEDTEDIVAWLMIQYNFYFSEMLVQKQGILLRTQESTSAPARYSLASPAAPSSAPMTHASMDHRLYGHFTSPIRRYADMNNQFVLFDLLDQTLDATALEELNARMTELSHFHYHEAITTLAYMYKQTPAVLDIEIKLTENGRFAYVQLPEKRVKVPLYDSYYSEPLSEILKASAHGTKHRIELFGIHKQGRAQLRMRFQETYLPKNTVIAVKQAPADLAPSLAPGAPGAPATPFDEALARIEGIAGYRLDAFQQQALQAMLDGDDVLGMAPTGSGKTILALMAIVLLAFDKGRRAIFTSPIKALSNQKYSEFTEWFGRLGGDHARRITLLTGDIQARATAPGGDGRGELLIMTSEILANKLESSRINQKLDPDLENVSIVITDEVHYICDFERGHVWETTLMTLPTDVQIVALSATLSEPQRFCDWMSRRKPTRLVQRFDRHVPLYIGGYDEDEMFVPFFSTHAENKTFATADYDRLYHSSVISSRMFSQPSELPGAISELVRMLDRDDKLPAIVFSMNRARCVQCAQSVRGNLLLGSQVRQRRGKDDFEHDRLVCEHQERSAEIKALQDAMYRRYLLPFRDMLEQIPGYQEFKQMLDRGVAYHHAGMIPILREYVEILFQNRLLRIVFATETLGVGINMPARTSVFTQLDKPNGRDSFRVLRPDEFWQMAGRAGRRGMDDKGYVLYYPFEETVSAMDMRNMLVGQLPSAISQLKIDYLFVLRHLKDHAILGKTLLHHQLQGRATVLRQELDKIPPLEGPVAQDAQTYKQFQEKLRMRGFIKLTPKQRAQYEEEMKKIAERHGPLDALVARQAERDKLQAEIAACETSLVTSWDDCMEWLIARGYATPQCDLTVQGKVSTMICDGLPLVRARILCDGKLKGLTFEHLVTFLAFFGEDVRIRRDAPAWKSLPDRLEDLFDESEKLAEELNERVTWASGAIMYMWCHSKDIREVCRYVDPSQIGSFIKMVLRTIAFIEELRPILLNLGFYELYNTLDGYHDRLLSGAVTNRSLYVSTDQT